jgi:hypothetical protein
VDQVLHDAQYSDRHFEKWLLQPLEAKYVVAKYPNLFIMYFSTCVPNLVLLSQNAQQVTYAALLLENTDCWFLHRQNE